MTNISIAFVTTSEPILTIDNKYYTGISILTQLKHYNELYPFDIEIKKYYQQASLYFQNSVIPVLKFILKDRNAVRPSRNLEDVGYDLTIIKEFNRVSKNTCIYDTGLTFQLPLGWYGAVHLRSSASKLGYIMSNCTGIIDPGYTGTIKIALTKIDHELSDIVLPIRIAQLIICPYANALLLESYLDLDTNRGDGGFGSTN